MRVRAHPTTGLPGAGREGCWRASLRPGTLARVLLAVLVAACGLSPGALAQAPGGAGAVAPSGPAAAPVVVVLSHDSPPYNDAASGVRIELRTAGIDMRIVRLDPAGRIAAGSGLAAGSRQPVIALGARAADALAAAGRADALSCMTLENPATSGLTLVHGADARLDRLRRLLPEARTLGVLVADGAGQAELADLQRAARRVGLRIIEQRVDLQRPLDGQLEPLVDRIDVLLGTYDLRIFSAANSSALMLFSYRNRVPLVGISDAWSRAGALFSYDWDYHDLGHQCGAMALRALASTSAATGIRGLSEVPRRLTFSVSLAAARYFRLTLPADVLREASRRFD